MEVFERATNYCIIHEWVLNEYMNGYGVNMLIAE
jgi:hypothetical protein